MKRLLPILLLLLASTAAAQGRARIVQLESGRYIGFFSLPDGSVVFLEDVEVVKLPSVVSTKPAVTAFVFDNDSPDIAWQSEMQLAIRELRKTYDAVLQIDDTPRTVGTLKHGKTIIDAAKAAGIPAIVVLDERGKVIRSVAMAKKAADMVKQAEGKR